MVSCVLSCKRILAPKLYNRYKSRTFVFGESVSHKSSRALQGGVSGLLGACGAKAWILLILFSASEEEKLRQPVPH